MEVPSAKTGETVGWNRCRGEARSRGLHDISLRCLLDIRVVGSGRKVDRRIGVQGAFGLRRCKPGSPRRVDSV